MRPLNFSAVGLGLVGLRTNTAIPHDKSMWIKKQQTKTEENNNNQQKKKHNQPPNNQTTAIVFWYGIRDSNNNNDDVDDNNDDDVDRKLIIKGIYQRVSITLSTESETIT